MMYLKPHAVPHVLRFNDNIRQEVIDITDDSNVANHSDNNSNLDADDKNNNSLDAPLNLSFKRKLNPSYKIVDG